MSEYTWRVADAYDVGRLARFCNDQSFVNNVEYGILEGINQATREFECLHSDGLPEDFRFCEVQCGLSGWEQDDE